MGEQGAGSELRSILESTTVGELTLSVRPELSLSDTVGDAAREMRAAKRGSVAIYENGRMSGIFTERDLLRFFAREECKLPDDLDTLIAEVMTRDPVTVSPDATVLEATRLMDEGHYRRLPVVDEHGSSTGFIDVKTISHFLVEHFPATIYNQASYRESLARNREGA